MTELVFTQEVIRSDIGVSELQADAEKSAASILLKIKEREKSILSAKDAAENAAKIETGWWRIGKTDEKLNATANALIKTNSALAEMNDLIQESIKITCRSIQFAQVMHKTMAHLMVTGFKDAHGNIQKLAGESEEFVQLILNEAEDFVSKQHAFEEKHAVLQARLNQKELDDAEQARRLEELQSSIDYKKSVDDRQEKAIQLLFKSSRQKEQLDIEQSNMIQVLSKQIHVGRLSLTISVASLIASFSALAMTYFR